MSCNRHLVVFAKYPVLGRVKTRLARDIGLVAATRFYRHTTFNMLLRLGRDPRWHCWLSLSPDTAVGDPYFWPKTVRPIKQGTGDIGQRMDRAIKKMPPGSTVIIGTDIPEIRPRHIEAAFSALGSHDVVFGPASDGGYWLVGARRSPSTPDLFSDIRWSSEHTLSDTLSKLQKGGSKIALLDTLDDVDDGAAYQKWLKKVDRD